MSRNGYHAQHRALSRECGAERPGYVDLFHKRFLILKFRFSESLVIFMVVMVSCFISIFIIHSLDCDCGGICNNCCTSSRKLDHISPSLSSFPSPTPVRSAFENSASSDLVGVGSTGNDLFFSSSDQMYKPKGDALRQGFEESNLEVCLLRCSISNHILILWIKVLFNVGNICA